MDGIGTKDLKYCKNCMEPLEPGHMVCPVCGYDNSITQNREPIVRKNTDPNASPAAQDNSAQAVPAAAAQPEQGNVSGRTGWSLEAITNDPAQQFASGGSYSDPDTDFDSYSYSSPRSDSDPSHRSDPNPYSYPDSYSYPDDHNRRSGERIPPAGAARRMPQAQAKAGKSIPWIWILIPVLLVLFIIMNIFIFWKIRNDRKQISQTAVVVLSPGVGTTPTVNTGSGAGSQPTAVMALDPISIKYTEIAQTQSAAGGGMIVRPTEGQYVDPIAMRYTEIAQTQSAAGGGVIVRPTEGQYVDPIAMKYTEVAQTQMAGGAFYPTATPQPPAVTGSDIRAGDIVTLGHYEQDNNLTNGAEPIEWQVLEVKNGEALLVSRYGLLVKDYHIQGSSDRQGPNGGGYDQQIPYGREWPFGDDYDQQMPFDMQWLYGGSNYDQQMPFDMQGPFGRGYDQQMPFEISVPYFRLGKYGYGTQILYAQRNGRQGFEGQPDFGSEDNPWEMEQRPDIPWKDCGLRTWLNSDFYNTAFSSEEQVRIKEFQTENASGFSIFGRGEETMDRIFLLSADQADQYFPDNEARKCYADQSAIAEGAYRDPATYASPWWIRSSSSNGPAIVDPYGTVGAEIRSEYIDGIVVRPALMLGL